MCATKSYVVRTTRTLLYVFMCPVCADLEAKKLREGSPSIDAYVEEVTLRNHLAGG